MWSNMDFLLQAAEMVFNEKSGTAGTANSSGTQGGTPSVAGNEEVGADSSHSSPLARRSPSAAETSILTDWSMTDSLISHSEMTANDSLSVSFRNVFSSTPRLTSLQRQPSFALDLSTMDEEEAPLDLSVKSVSKEFEVPLNLVVTPANSPQCKPVFHMPLNLAFGKRTSIDDTAGSVSAKNRKPLHPVNRLSKPARRTLTPYANVLEDTMNATSKIYTSNKENVHFENDFVGLISGDDKNGFTEGRLLQNERNDMSPELPAIEWQHNSTDTAHPETSPGINALDDEEIPAIDRQHNSTDTAHPETSPGINALDDEDSDDASVDDGEAMLLNDFSIMEIFEPYRIDSVIVGDADSEDLLECPAAETEAENASPGNDFGFAELNESNMVKTKKPSASYDIVKNKNLKVRGEAYTRPNGKKVAARRVKPACFCSKRQCHTKVNNEIRNKLLINFLKLTPQAQNQFLSNHVSICPVKYHRVLNSKRTFSRKYHLPGVGGNVQVCKAMFLATFDVTDKKIRVLATKKSKCAGVCPDDGRMANSSHNRISSEDKKRVEDHIKSFPLYTSHYGRARSDKLYLSSDLNIAKIYDLYVQKCSNDKCQPVHYNTFRMVFKTFNISFRSPQVDTCCECDKLHVLIKQSSSENDKDRLQADLEAHQANAQQVYDRKKRDVQLAKTEKTVCTASFDLQKCLPTPHLVCGQAFYSRQLYTLNLTVYETFHDHNVGRCYLWDESKARRGSQEVGSCLYLYLKSIIQREAQLTSINLYSDRCSGQNHNIVICMTLALLVEECSKNNRTMTVRHNFMISGHSHMEVDSVHASIERAKKRTTMNIETPRDYAVFISQVRRKIPLEVVEMEQSQFLALKQLDKRFKRPKLDDDGVQVRFKEIAIFEYRSQEIGKVFFKTNPNHEYRSFTILEDTQSPLPVLNPIETSPIPLSQEKLNDLKKLMPYISNKVYYETLLKSLSAPKRGRKKLTEEDINFDRDMDLPEEAWPVEYLDDV